MTIETANRLYELRKKQGLSQEELAEKLGVSRQAISKWERSEASPDTDNLIALAKIYGLSLDELIYGEKQNTQKNEQKTEQKGDEENCAENENSSTDDNSYHINIEDKDGNVKIGAGSILVESNDGDKVTIRHEGILVESNDREKVKIGFNGLKIGMDVDVSIDDDDEEDEEWQDQKTKEKYKSSIWRKLPYPVLCLIAYLIFGCLKICGGWALSWIIFATIPLYYSFVKAIYKRRLSSFAYPVFTVTAYLFAGLYFSCWHPSWIIFVTIPVYYFIAGLIDKKTHSRRKE